MSGELGPQPNSGAHAVSQAPDRHGLRPYRSPSLAIPLRDYECATTGVSNLQNDNIEEGYDNEEKRSNTVALSVETREQLKQQMFQHLDELCCRLMKEGLTEEQVKPELEAIATEALREVRLSKAA